MLTVAAAILTIFGIVLLLLLTFHSESKVDTAIHKMERDFKELTGKQLRKPKLQCYIEGRDLANAVISLFIRNNAPTSVPSIPTAFSARVFARKNFSCAPETGKGIQFPVG
ncbi:MAG: hypothetical protein ACLQVJ_05500, partial [Syntrophobacteraceae bacterium]